MLKASLIAAVVSLFGACAPVVVEGPPPPPPRRVMVVGPAISVRAASYGPNCGAPRGNVSGRVAELCDGKGRCLVPVDNSVFGDPAVGCPKELVVEFSCGRELRRERAGEHASLELVCR